MRTVGSADPQQVATSATRISQLVDRILPQIASTQFDTKLLATLLQNIAGDSQAIAQAGFRTAEQAVMALEALFLVYQEKSPQPEHDAIRKSIRHLFELVQQPHTYNPQDFRHGLRMVYESLSP